MPRATINANGINEYLQIINRLGGNIEETAKKAVYEGAAIIADQVKANIEALPVDEHWGTPQSPLHGVKKYQKEGLLESFGVAPMRNDKGLINTRVGFDDAGYNSHGQPNAMIARATESGTTFSDKIPFFENAVRTTRNAAKQKMIAIVEKEMEKLSKE